MAMYDRDRDHRGRLQMNEFYEEIGANRGYAATNEMLYISSHTIYLREGINYKREILRSWREDFGQRLSDEAWEYVAALYPSFCIIGIIEDMKLGRGISREYVRWKTIVRLEMDIKLIECAENNVTFNMEDFRNYINKKYNFAFENMLDEIEDNDVPYIENFPALGKALMKYKKEIQDVYEKLYKSCEEGLKLRMDSSENKSRSRRRSRKPRIQKVADTPKVTPEPAPAVEEKVVEVAQEKVEPKKVEPKKVEPEIKSEPAPADAKDHALKDYEVIIAEYEEKIRRLENDVAEYQRRHDEIREFSTMQYDRGIKDLFNILNDNRYSKPIDFLYKLMQNPTLNANVRSYLENFFLALEEMEIEPIVQAGQAVVVSPARMTANYNLEFDIKDFVPEKTTVKYAGWKYKDSILEKPTLSKNN